MKRKWGHKKGKQKKPSAVNSVAIDTEDNSVLDDLDDDDSQLDSSMEVEVPASVVPNQPPTFTNTNADGLTDRPAGRSGIGRVKVKLKSSKLLEHQRTYSDMQAQSDTDKSSQHVSLEKQGEVEKTDDSANSLPGTQSAVSEKAPRKAGTLKIKSSRGIINLTSSPVQVQGERNTQTASDNDKTVDSSVSRESQQREPKFPLHDSQYNEQELNVALMVIKKIMKMDAAEPFNIPVDPDALGIPDYFEVIDTPMDFGTICDNLEHGNRYMNSEDVFKDVQYIWENCYKYNNKGDYIVDLMKRVKKNFMKYWMAAGLYIDKPKRTNDAALDQDSGIELPPQDDIDRDKSKLENVGTPCLNGSESIWMENVAQSSQEKVHVKGTPSKNKTRRRHGISHHKSNCLCAVCVVRRKRKEREGNAQIVENQIEISDGNPSQVLKREDASGTPFSEDASSNLEPSPDPGADADMEEQGEEMKSERSEQQHSPSQDKQEISDNEVENQNKDVGEPSEQLQIGDGSGEDPNPQSRSQEMEDSGFVTQVGSQKNDSPLQQKEEPATVQKLQQKKQEELEKWNQQTYVYKKLFGDENPSQLELCGTLFPDDPKSVWGGPHSLAHHNASSVRSSSSGIHAAIAMFMK
ncbi:Bromodomain [Macleaya cordata]|uniref:Bromodomain n=1 Tax=Macleaya cordata TaxID=56857 RepID=A0A200Q1E2_MACCD|nr:Bromodomain [Macleaya cordata]